MAPTSRGWRTGVGVHSLRYNLCISSSKSLWLCASLFPLTYLLPCFFWLLHPQPPILHSLGSITSRMAPCLGWGTFLLWYWVEIIIPASRWRKGLLRHLVPPIEWTGKEVSRVKDVLCFRNPPPPPPKAAVRLLLNKESWGWQRRRGVVNKSRTFSLINILCTCVVFSLVPGLKLSMGFWALVYIGFSALYFEVWSADTLTRKRRYNELSICALLPDTLYFLSSPHFWETVIFQLPVIPLQQISPVCSL